MIISKDISFVVQGAVNKDTKLVLDALRLNFPKSEIILSTWNNSVIDNFYDYDILVLSEDPGTFNCLENRKLAYNLDRQIISSKNGIDKASRKYIAKIRSDLLIQTDEFMSYFKKRDLTIGGLTLFKEKILIGDLYTRNPLKMKRNMMLFHFGDFFYFGLKNDIKELFNIKLSGIIIANYFKINNIYNPIDENILFKYTPEQYIILQNLNKTKTGKNIDIEHPFYSTYKLYKIHIHFFIANFQYINLKKVGIKSLKYIDIEDKSLYSLNEYKRLLSYNINRKICIYTFSYFVIKCKHFLKRMIRLR